MAVVLVAVVVVDAGGSVGEGLVALPVPSGGAVIN
jgi:hypothetical protein